MKKMVFLAVLALSCTGLAFGVKEMCIFGCGGGGVVMVVHEEPRPDTEVAQIQEAIARYQAANDEQDDAQQEREAAQRAQREVEQQRVYDDADEGLYGDDEDEVPDENEEDK